MTNAQSASQQHDESMSEVLQLAQSTHLPDSRRTSSLSLQISVGETTPLLSGNVEAISHRVPPNGIETLLEGSPLEPMSASNREPSGSDSPITKATCSEQLSLLSELFLKLLNATRPFITPQRKKAVKMLLTILGDEKKRCLEYIDALEIEDDTPKAPGNTIKDRQSSARSHIDYEQIKVECQLEDLVKTAEQNVSERKSLNEGIHKQQDKEEESQSQSQDGPFVTEPVDEEESRKKTALDLMQQGVKAVEGLLDEIRDIHTEAGKEGRQGTKQTNNQKGLNFSLNRGVKLAIIGLVLSATFSMLNFLISASRFSIEMLEKFSWSRTTGEHVQFQPVSGLQEEKEPCRQGMTELEDDLSKETTVTSLQERAEKIYKPESDKWITVITRTIKTEDID